MVIKILCLTLLSLAFCHVAFADVYISMPTTNDVAPAKTFLQKVKDFIAKIVEFIISAIRRIGSEIRNIFQRPGTLTNFIKSIPQRVVELVTAIINYIVALPGKALNALRTLPRKLMNLAGYITNRFVGMIGPRVKTLAVTAVDTAAESAFKLGDKYIEKDPEFEQFSKDFEDLENEEPEP